jgi:hypothetical protein
MAKKSRSSKAKASAFLLLAIAVAACGGASEKPAASPADEASPAAVPVNQDAQPPAPPAMPSTQSASPTSSGGSDSTADRKAEMASAATDLDTARRDVETSFGDCANVCRALSSLERVTAHFCALASSNSERDACEDAKRRVYEARARIKESCGTCANGAPLDANAPLNSR